MTWHALLSGPQGSEPISDLYMRSGLLCLGPSLSSLLLVKALCGHVGFQALSSGPQALSGSCISSGCSLPRQLGPVPTQLPRSSMKPGPLGPLSTSPLSFHNAYYLCLPPFHLQNQCSGFRKEKISFIRRAYHPSELSFWFPSSARSFLTPVFPLLHSCPAS